MVAGARGCEAEVGKRRAAAGAARKLEELAVEGLEVKAREEGCAVCGR